VSSAFDNEMTHLATLSETQNAIDQALWTDAALAPSLWSIQVTKRVGVAGDISLTDVTCTAPLRGALCPAYQARKDVLRFLSVIEVLSKEVAEGVGIDRRLRGELRDARWAAYHDDGLFQWPWELRRNGRRLGQSEACGRYASGMQRGFCAVPRKQVIFFHPDVALQWRDGAGSSSDLDGIAVMEVFGRYWWKWGGKSGAEVEHARGFSVMATYGPADNKSRFGGGLMYHGPRGNSIGLTFAKDKVGVVASIGVSDRLFDATDRAKTRMQEFVNSAEK
jgi:hypothetical protein